MHSKINCNQNLVNYEYNFQLKVTYSYIPDSTIDIIVITKKALSFRRQSKFIHKNNEIRSFKRINSFPLLNQIIVSLKKPCFFS